MDYNIWVSKHLLKVICLFSLKYFVQLQLNMKRQLQTGPCANLNTKAFKTLFAKVHRFLQKNQISDVKFGQKHIIYDV